MKQQIDRRGFPKGMGCALATLPFAGSLIAAVKSEPSKEVSNPVSESDRSFMEMDKMIMSVAKNRDGLKTPIPGDQWIDTSDPRMRTLKVYDGGKWKVAQVHEIHH